MASFIEELLGGLFSKKSSPILVKENISQNPADMEAVRTWLRGEEWMELNRLISKNYYFKKSGIQASPEIHILNSPYANGFAVSFENPFTDKTFSQLFFAFGQRMLDLGYQRVSLDRKMEEVNEQVRTTEKQYFKPFLGSPDFSSKIDQLYGNVSIEKVSIDDKPSFLKILVTVYSDHHYQKAKPFDGFIEELFPH